MATSAQTSSASPVFDPLDIDRYINYDPNTFPSPLDTPTSSESKPVPSPNTTTYDPSNASLLPAQSNNPRTFAGPSHQYDLHRQQAGLPTGALANTMAVNQADHLSFGRSPQYVWSTPTDGYFGECSADDYIDFGTAPSQNASSGAATDMDIDFGSPTHDMFMQNLNSSTADYINPAAIGGQEDLTESTDLLPSAPAVNTRVWPGMHQQAALAKAQAQSQQQKQQLASESLNMTTPRHPTQRSLGNGTRPPPDPIVEERISRLLNQMRHSSVASSNDDDAATPNANGSSSHTGRTRKDEEDMDEDERLLASEEGKRLSSKERRQLRNKVSARAFRSRRKEYIGQLEGEIAAKATEADNLRVKNEDLMAENTRLTDLTRMLLESPSFSNFLNDLSGGVVPPSAKSSVPAPIISQQPTMKVEQTQPTIQKDINPHHAVTRHAQNHHQGGPQIGMTLIPEHNVDYTAFDRSNQEWTTNNMDFSLYDAQVFSVIALPEGPVFEKIDIGILSGKSSNVIGSYPAHSEDKGELPVIERFPSILEGECETPADLPLSNDDVDFDESDPAFALFSYRLASTQQVAVDSEYQLFGSIDVDKVFGRVELILEEEANDNTEVSSATMGKFERICSYMEAASERIAAVTSHI